MIWTSKNGVMLSLVIGSLLLSGCGNEDEEVSAPIRKVDTRGEIVGIIGGTTSDVRVSGTAYRNVGIIERNDEDIRNDLVNRYPKLSREQLDEGVKFVRNLVVKEGLPDALWNEYYVEPKNLKIEAKTLVDSLSGDTKFSVGDTKLINAGAKRMDLINKSLKGLEGKDRAGLSFEYDLVTYGYGDKVIVLVNRGGKLSDYKLDVFPSHVMTYDMTAYMFALYFANLSVEGDVE